jgi:hypothetical protein
MIRELTELFPLVKSGELIDYSYQMQKIFVTKVLSENEPNFKLNKDNLLHEIMGKYNLVNFPKEKYEKILVELEKEEKIELCESDSIILRSPINIESRDVLHDHFLEFQKYIKDKFPEYDPYKDSNFEECFCRCIYHLIDRFIQIQRTNWTQIESFEIGEIRTSLQKIILESDIVQQKKFLTCFSEYLKSGEEKITNLMFNSYKLAISYDILEKTSRLTEIADEICKGGCIILDSNIITYLLCKTDSKYSISKSIVELSNKLCIKIYYTRKTSQEVHDILNMANDDLQHKKISVDINRMNQFLADFNRRGMKFWADYYTSMQNFEKILKSDYNISLLELGDITTNTELIGNLEELISETSVALGRDKTRSSIDHDIHLFTVVDYLRKKNPNSRFQGPWILSYEKILNVTNNFLKRRAKDNVGFALYPITWLNILLCFQHIQFNPEQRGEIVKGLLDQMVVPDDILSLEQYVSMLSYSLELEPQDQETLLNMFTTSTLHRELIQALNQKDTEDAMSVAYEILTNPDVRNLIFEETKIRRERETQRYRAKKLMELTKENEYLLEKLKKYESRDGKDINITVSQSQNANQKIELININWTEIGDETKKLRDELKENNFFGLGEWETSKIEVYLDDLEEEINKQDPDEAMVKHYFKKLDRILSTIDGISSKSQKILESAKKISKLIGITFSFLSL